MYDLSASAPSKIFPVIAKSGVVSKLNISWTSPPEVANPIAGCPNVGGDQLPVAANWQCGYGIIRMDVTNSTSLNRTTLMANTFTAFLYPTVSGTGSVSFTGSGTNIHGSIANQGAIPDAKCDGTKCKMTIYNLNGSDYYVRVSTLYRDTKFQLTALDSSSNPLSLTGAQVVIDSTGRANDVLRRLQVRIPLINNGLHSDYGVESTHSICKRFVAYPGLVNNTICP